MMAKIERYEDLIAWQRARKLTASVYRLARDTGLKSDFGLRDQICRAAVSVMANLAEGFGRKANKDFAGFLYHAKASCLEVSSHLYVALDQDYLSKPEFDKIYDGYNRVAGMITNLIRHLEQNPGARF